MIADDLLQCQLIHVGNFDKLVFKRLKRSVYTKYIYIAVILFAWWSETFYTVRFELFENT